MKSDLLVLPADLYLRLISTEKWLPKVIAYGSHFHLKSSFLSGCADYIVEPPLYPVELEIRIRRVIDEIRMNHTFSWGSLSFSGTDAIAGDHVVGLNYQEFQILRLLLRYRGEVVPREALFYTIWKNTGRPDSRVVDMHISGIRKKLNNITGKECAVIKSVRNKGYQIPF